MLSNSTREFGVYFHKEWLSKAAQWIAAFRSGATLTTNNFLESWHSKLKGGFLSVTNRTAERYVTKRLLNTIYATAYYCWQLLAI